MEATEKQVQFIARLVEEREIHPTGTARLLLEMWDFDRTRETATVLIDALMALPRLHQDKAPAPSGLHVLDGEVYRVVVSRDYGVRYGVCAACGRTLTNPESIEYGIGPICRTRYWG